MSNLWDKGKKPFNMRVEYDSAPVRHCAVQCPECEKWFYGYDVIEDGSLTYDYELGSATFRCPLCNTRFGCGTEYDDEKIAEVSHPKVYEGCLEKIVSWE